MTPIVNADIHRSLGESDHRHDPSPKADIEDANVPHKNVDAASAPHAQKEPTPAASNSLIEVVKVVESQRIGEEAVKVVERDESDEQEGKRAIKAIEGHLRGGHSAFLQLKDSAKAAGRQSSSYWEKMGHKGGDAVVAGLWQFLFSHMDDMKSKDEMNRSNSHVVTSGKALHEKGSAATSQRNHANHSDQVHLKPSRVASGNHTNPSVQVASKPLRQEQGMKSANATSAAKSFVQLRSTVMDPESDMALYGGWRQQARAAAREIGAGESLVQVQSSSLHGKKAGKPTHAEDDPNHPLRRHAPARGSTLDGGSKKESLLQLRKTEQSKNILFLKRCRKLAKMMGKMLLHKNGTLIARNQSHATSFKKSVNNGTAIDANDQVHNAQVASPSVSKLRGSAATHGKSFIQMKEEAVAMGTQSSSYWSHLTSNEAIVSGLWKFLFRHMDDLEVNHSQTLASNESLNVSTEAQAGIANALNSNSSLTSAESESFLQVQAEIDPTSDLASEAEHGTTSLDL